MENTPNIGLKRWEGGDRVLHAEFNDNWDKLDAGLGQALLEKRAIKTVTLTEPKSTNEIPLDGINWAEWSFVGIELPYRPDSNDTMVITYYANNGQPLSFFTKDHAALMTAPVNPCMLVLLPMRDPERYVSAVSFIPGGGYGYNPTLKFKDLRFLHLLYPTKKFPAGQKLYIWGIR